MNFKHLQLCFTPTRILPTLVVLGMIISPLHLEAGIIRLLDSATVQYEMVTLGEIADISELDPVTTAEMRRTVICPAPVAGREVVLTFDQVRSVLNARGMNMSSITFTGKSQVRVVNAAPVAVQEAPRVVQASNWQVESAQKILTESIRSYYGQQNPQCLDCDLKVEFPTELVNDFLSGDPRSLIIEGAIPQWNQPQIIGVRFNSAKSGAMQMPVRVCMTQLPLVLSVRETLPRGHVVREQDLVWKKVTAGTAGVNNPKEVIGHELVRTIRADEVLDPTFMRKTPLVRNQDLVSVYVRNPMFSIQRQFKAKGDAALGETVALVTLDNKESIMARVTGFREAEIVPIGANDSLIAAPGAGIPMAPLNPTQPAYTNQLMNPMAQTPANYQMPSAQTVTAQKAPVNTQPANMPQMQVYQASMQQPVQQQSNMPQTPMPQHPMMQNPTQPGNMQLPPNFNPAQMTPEAYQMMQQQMMMQTQFQRYQRQGAPVNGVNSQNNTINNGNNNYRQVTPVVGSNAPQSITLQ